MSKNKYQEVVEQILSRADININGSRPFDLQVSNDNFYKRFLGDGLLGLGESYMDGWWDCERIDELVTKIFHANLIEEVNKNPKVIFYALKAKLFNMQTRRKSQAVVKQHYNLGNDLFMSFLDPYNQYTCGYFKDTADLNAAQRQKLDLICRKLKLNANDRVLDIGCGWGGFAKFAAEHYKCHVTGITISDEQLQYAENYCRGLPIKILNCDYRDLRGKFDKILVCGMIEHVGHKNYRSFMSIVHDCLSDDGLFLLDTIGGNIPITRREEPWICKYIYPNSEIPSIKQIGNAIEGLFVMEDWHNFGTDYVKTLLSWRSNFVSNWDSIKSRYDERFYRMWNYYLLISVGGFRARVLQEWQIVLSKIGTPEGYQKHITYHFD